MSSTFSNPWGVRAALGVLAAVAPGRAIALWVRLHNEAAHASFVIDPALPLFTLDGALSLPIGIGPGASLTYRLGTFFPVGGGAPPGRCEFYQGSVSLLFGGADAQGRPLSLFTSPVRTCSVDSAAGCMQQGVDYFVRTAVPEPDTYGLLGLGLLAVLGWARARRPRARGAAPLRVGQGAGPQAALGCGVRRGLGRQGRLMCTAPPPAQRLSSCAGGRWAPRLLRLARRPDALPSGRREGTNGRPAD